VRRVKLLWVAPVLAAVTLGIVFLRCVGDMTDVDEPLRWRNAWEVSFGIRPLDSEIDTLVKYINEVLATVDDAVSQGINSVLDNSKLGEGQRDSLAGAISGSDSLMSKVLDDDFGDYLHRFMDNDPAASAIIQGNGLSGDVGKIVDAVAWEVKSSKETVEGQLFDLQYWSGEPERINLGEGARDYINNMRETPKIAYDIYLSNRTPLSLKIYVLLFEERKWLSDISVMNDAEFQEFVDGLSNKDTTYVNLVSSGGGGKMIERGSSSSMLGGIPLSLMTGASPPWLKLLIVLDTDDLGAILGGLRELVEKRVFMDAMLKIRIEGTNDLESLFDF